MMLDKEKFLGSGSWELILQTGEISWSDGKYRLFGYDPDGSEPLPQVNLELYKKHVSEDQLQKMEQNWHMFLENLEEHTWEYELTSVNGERKRLETYGKLVRDKDGKAEKVIGASRDVTRMRNYEESLKHKIEELDRSNKELEEFAYIASHDLQEPLRKITAFSERLKDRSGPALGTEGNIYLDRMLVATQNMRLLIDNLLEFSRTSRHNQPFEDVDLSKILAEVKAELELKIEETRAIIECPELPIIEGIPSQLRQLFTNLLSNAIKFRKPDTNPKIRINFSKLSKKEKQSLRLKEETSYIQIKVNDDGIGFEKEYAVKIFQIFQRLHGKSEYPGSGIGLAICKKIAENHYGVIYAESEPGQGASFIVVLPEKQL